MSNQLLIHRSLKSRLVFDIESQPRIKFFIDRKHRGFFVNLSISRGHITLSGIVTLSANCLRFLPDKHIVRIIMELARNQSLTLTTCNNNQSRLHHFKNDVPPGSILAALVFDSYMYDLPCTISRKFTYPDNLTLLQPFETERPSRGL